ncbi:hypothetical protein N480_21605 [Pseudoalteromonas luteoviolacea S2607]|uniref:non-ribosomal peptide synthetase n=1 Tax=Pseudoalteromonas luteoviolacea TaxID=43657 RepID=UPI0007B07860|nr:non-ribosomal peptide synthetase [Pseudoalteromonas luteoviolacea]KZN34202.1 hypothetical protein N480_21605 [Pseudoalteromonas luteoviolacea S2607]
MQHVYNLLLAQGVQLYLDGEKLKARSLKKEMTRESIELIKKNKLQLMEFLRIKESVDSREKISPIEKVNLHEYRASFAQQRLWFIDNLQSGTTEYNMPLVFDFKGVLNLEALTEAINKIVLRHEILRTVYHLIDGEVNQTVKPFYADKCKPSLFDLTQVSEEERKIELEKIITSECEKQFNLSEDVMLRLSCIKLRNSSGKLILNTHHIASDGWSIQILTRELCELYNAYCHEKASSLPELKIQYIDYSYWLDNYLSDDLLESRIKYWTEHLANAPTIHSIPLDYPRPDVKQNKGALVTGQISSRTTQKLIEVAKQHRLTPFMLLHAMLSLLLARHSNSTSIVMGTPTANRHHEDLEALIGFFVNTLILKIDVKQGTILDYLSHVRQTHLDAQSNQDIPFDKLVERMHVTRSASHTPLFQIMVTKSEDFAGTNKNALQSISLHELDLTPTNSGFIPAKFDLVVDFNIKDHHIDIEWIYDCSLFNEQHIAKLNGHLCHLLDAVSEASEMSLLSQLDMLSDSEKNHLLYTLNDTYKPKEDVDFVHQLFEQYVESNPENTAVALSDRSITYRHLNERANQLARYLKQQYGIGPNVLVGVCSERTIEMALSILAIFKAGGTYVPLDPKYPRARLEYMIADSGLELLLGSEPQLNKLNELVTKCQPVERFLTSDHDAVWLSNDKHNLEASDVALSVDDLAYVIYTSGSTGKPKGVMIKHSGLIHSILHSTRCAPFKDGSNAVIYHATSLAFDAALWIFWCALASGAKLRLAASLDFQQELESYSDVTHLFLTPSILECIEPSNYHSLKVVATGGESCSLELVNKWRAQGIEFYNCYGPTEISICSSVGNITNSEQLHIGRQNTNVQYFIFDAQQQLLPFGAIGELYIGGAGLAQGYLNQPELTKDRFIANPYYDPSNSNSCKTLYRTGDLVNYLPDGNVVFRGRIDDQVKIRGVRIELGEISACLSAMSTVDSAHVILKKVNGNDILVGYVKLSCNDDDANKSLEKIKLDIAQQLPEHMKPSAFLIVESWPTTANGKIDTTALPTPQLIQEEYIEPATENEKMLALVWSELLNIPSEHIGTNANFFELGGHSLLCVRLLTVLRAKSDAEVSVKDIFENPTLGAFATCLTHSQQVDNNVLAHSLVQEGEAVPLSFAQQRLWFINKLQGESPEYNISLVFDLEGKFDLDIANKAFLTIVQRHKILRSVYQEREGEAVQYIKPFSQVEFSICNYTLLDKDAETRQQALEQLVAEQCSLPFDLSQDLMLRVCFIERDHTMGTLIVSMHHIASDGWSMEILRNEFTALYNQLRVNNMHSLEPLKIQYADYALRLRSQLAQGHLAKQFEYWQRQLESAPTLHSLPLDYKRPEVKGRTGAVVSATLSSEVTRKLISIANDNKLTTFMLLHSALSLLLARHSNEQHIVIGTPIANRTALEAEQLIGFFVNMLVLNVDTEHASLSSYFEHVRTVNIDAQSNQDATVDQLVERLRVPRSNAYSPLFQIVMALNNDFSGAAGNRIGNALHGIEMWPRSTNNIQSKFDLEIDFEVGELGMTVHWTYDVELFSQGHVELLCKHLCQLLEQLSHSNPDDSLASLSLLSEGESQALLSKINSTHVPYDTHQCIHHKFAEVAARYPQSTALIYNGASLNYAELNEQADCLAAYLTLECGIQTGSFIGLSTHPSLELVVGILAILKAGAAYIPIEPSYPDERVEFILQDSGTSLVLCQDESEKNLITFSGRAVSIAQGCSLGKALKPQWYAASKNVVTSDDLAYVIYTSGSTGTPKGVLIEHRSVINLITSQNENYQIKPNSEEVGLLLSTYAFDASVEQMFTMLLSANTLVIPKTQSKVDVKALTSLIATYKVTHIDSTPSHLMSICDLLNASSIKRVVSGGEAMLPSLLTHVKADVFNVYGPTEACVTSSLALNSETLGNPLNNTQYYVLGKDLQFTPFNGIGELYIGGDGLARGYLNRPELTQQHFIDNPFYDESTPWCSPRLYKTGDLVRYLPDGNLSFVGRVDDQVKIRGFRIELGELESRIAAIDMIDSAVVTVSDMSGTQQLVAYVKATKSVEQDREDEFREEIKGRLVQQLPIYMIPSVLMVVQAWPLTVNGKVNRRLLPKPDLSAVQSDYTPPSTDLEHQIRVIWARILDLDPESIGTNSSFFDLGGHSLLAVKVLSAIQSKLCSSMELTMLFSHNTITEQAKCISSLGNEQNSELLHKVTSFESNAPALIFIPGVASTERDFEHIIEKLDVEGYEIGVLKHKGLREQEAYFNSLEEAAIAYGNLLISKNLTNIKLIGHSFGGALAVEIASYLQRHNCKVNIALLDTYFLKGSFIDLNKYNDEVESSIEHSGIPSHMIALYRHQSQLHDEYIPANKIDCKVDLVFAKNSPIELSTYKQYLDSISNFKYERIFSVEGDHKGILQEKGASKIVRLLTGN